MHWCDEEFFEKGAYLAEVTPGKILLGKGGTVERVSSFTPSTETLFYLKDFFTDEYLCYRPRETLELTKEELISEFEPGLVSFISVTTDDGIYEKDFLSLQRHFGLTLEKVVLISREEFKANQPALGKKNLFLRSLTFGTGMSYGFWYEDYGITGSSPEILFSVKGDELSTMALAGTAKKGQEDELMSSEKERLEHQLVVVDLEEKLSPFCDDIEIGVTGTQPFKNIIHLRTDLSGRLKPQANLGKLTSALSPTAALGGYPKKQALRFLQETEYQRKHGQRYYGSAFGVSGPKSSLFVVMIRNVQWKGKSFFIESGGGVLPASLLDSELEELRLKRSIIRGHYL